MTAPEVPERPPAVIDPRPRQLLEKYASLVGALLMDLGEGLVEFEVPAGERSHWGRDRVVRIALVPEALDEEPEAELLGVGSPVFERLITAIRARGFLATRGLVPPSEDPSAEAATIPAPLQGASAGESTVELTLLPVGRLLARVSIKAGPRLEERMVESPLVDLSTGAAVAAEIAAVLGVAESGPGAVPPAGVQPVPRRTMEELLPLLFDELQHELAGDIARIRDEAEWSRRAEVERLDRYYSAMVEEVEPEEDPEAAKAAKRAIRAELERRKDEEEERFRVRVTVHPLQLIEWQVFAQRATWPLMTPKGCRAPLQATRLLIGDVTWRLVCPSCGTEPSAIRVCQTGHASCPACSERCGVCSETACRSHGLTTCAAEGHPVCAEHARTCGSCGGYHCSAHSGRCVVGDHEVCPSCVVQCGRCAVGLCRAHGTQTLETAPKGARWLCSACLVHCEGGTNEPVGLDEVVRCTSCERHICETHRVACAVDGQPHCSRHLRRSDRSGRLACEGHRAGCADEPGSVLASDEVTACVSCGKVICDAHGGPCDADGAGHCISHLAALADRPGRKGCDQHRTTCHVDGVSFSMTGTRPCPVCGKATCEAHRVACPSCARQVCVRDVEEGKCITCMKLEEIADPPDDLIQAALAANGGEPPKVKAWKAARDDSGAVVELDLGWTRRLVFTVPHDEVKPKTVVQHSMLGARRLR
jgi:hypothetical protein